MQLPSGTDTLKKHVLLLFDRLDKGGKLSTTASPAGAGGAGANVSGPSPTTAVGETLFA